MCLMFSGTPNGSSLDPFLESEPSVEPVEAKDSSPDNLSPISNGIIAPELVNLLGTNLSEHTANNELIRGISGPACEAPQLSLWEKLALYKYDIVLLSIVLQVLSSLTASSADTFYLFLPVAIYTITKIVWLPSKQQSNIANFLLLLNGMSPTKVQIFTKIAQLFSVFSQDVCVFLFMTICLQSLLSVFGDQYLR